MAGDGGGRREKGAGVLLPVEGRSEMAIPSSAAIAGDDAVKKEKWEVEYSRFFNFPSSPGGLFASTNLRPLPACKTRSGGIWITASSPALLCLRKHHANSSASAVLSVSVRRRIHEEHFISNLNIFWPQVSCASECPIRGSRVMFFCYRDCSSQIQKFAVRFSTSSMVQDFQNVVEEISSNRLDVRLQRSDLVCENSNPSEYIASNGHRIDEESSFEPPTLPCGPQLPALTCKDEETECLLQPLLAKSTTNFLGLPPSFTELLNCSMQIEKEQLEPTKEAALASQDERCVLDASFNASVTEVLNAVEPERPMKEAHLNPQFQQYMSDVSFHDMLSKIEQVIDELGEDMSL